jgi:quercetin dioxygenase-like cupin family protein
MAVVGVRAEERVQFDTPGNQMLGMAAPSRGSSELAVWRVRVDGGASGPRHKMGREQVLHALSGRLHAEVDGDTVTVEAGDTLVLPAGVVRRLRNEGETPFKALVAMPAGGVAEREDGTVVGVPPWAA